MPSGVAGPSALKSFKLSATALTSALSLAAAFVRSSDQNDSKSAALSVFTIQMTRAASVVNLNGSSGAAAAAGAGAGAGAGACCARAEAPTASTATMTAI